MISIDVDFLLSFVIPILSVLVLVAALVFRLAKR